MPQSEAVSVFALITSQPGKERQMREILTGLVEPTRAEPGCLHYMLHEDPKALGSFQFFEVYKDQAGVDAHMQSPHFKAAFAQLGELTQGTPSIITTKLIAGG